MQKPKSDTSNPLPGRSCTDVGAFLSLILGCSDSSPHTLASTSHQSASAPVSPQASLSPAPPLSPGPPPSPTSMRIARNAAKGGRKASVSDADESEADVGRSMAGGSRLDSRVV
eukprot:2242899-Rhodomonas_salina.1